MEKQQDLFQSQSNISSLSFEELQSKLEEKIPDAELLKGLSKEEKGRWIKYLYANPRPETQKLNLRNHVIGLYDPFASREDFRAGRRWCVNVYVGCAFSCKYCYIISYIRDAFHPRVKENFRKSLQDDLEELQELNLNPAPIHISNSTDPLQPLEKVHKNTLFLLQQLRKHRQCFTTITLLTKNPALLCEPEYMEVIQTLSSPFQVEVTCPFYRDESRQFFEPGAPKVESRLEGIRKLREKDITVALRMDPIFPREPLPKEFFDKTTLEDYDAPKSQTEEDIEQLITFASEVGCSRIIVSPLKLVVARFNKSKLLPVYRKLYAASNKGKPIKKGTAYRLPWELYQYWLNKPKEIANSLDIELIYCKKNLFETL